MAPRRLLSLVLAVLVPALVAPAHGDVTPSTPASRFALDMASTTLNNTTFMAVGANNKAYIYKQNPITLSWTLETALQPNAPSPEQLFGYSVAIRAISDGSILAAIGAPGKGVAVPGGAWLKEGAVYLFRRAAGGTTWSQEAILESGNIPGDFLGESVAISPNGIQVAIGMSYANNQGCGGAIPSGTRCFGTPHIDEMGNGDVVIFRKISTGWQSFDRLAPAVPDPQFDECLGRGLAFSNLPTEQNELLVGAPGPIDTASFATRRVFVFRQSAPSNPYTLVQTLSSSSQGFGHDIAVDEANARAVVGAPFGNTTGTGAAHVLKKTAGVWAFEASLVPPKSIASTANAHFGGSVSAVAGRFLVGTGRRVNAIGNDPNLFEGGVERAYLYRVQTGDSTWNVLSEVRHALTSNPVTGDRFGGSVCIGTMNTPSGYYMAVGMPFRDVASTDNGAFAVFDAGSNKAMSSFLGENGALGVSSGVRGLRAFAGTGFDWSSGGPDAGSALMIGFDGARWFVDNALSTGTPGDRFASSGVVIDDNRVVFGAPGALVGSPAVRKGRVHLATRSSTGTWSLQASGVPSGITANAELGHSVAGVIRTGTSFMVASGAPFANHSGRTAAGVVVIQKGTDIASNTPFQVLTAPNPKDFDRFGAAVAMERYSNGDLDLWISAPGRDTAAGRDSGALFLYRLKAAGESFLLEAADVQIQSAKPGDLIGEGPQQMGLRSNLLVVGGTRDASAAAPDSGVVGVIQRSTGGVWAVRPSVAPTQANTGFGFSVATNGTQYVVGAPQAADTGPFPLSSGRHDLFKVSSLGNSVQLTSIFQSDRQLDDLYGWSVAINTGSAPPTFIGAPGDDIGRTAGAGSVYGFAGPANPCASDFDGDGVNGPTDLAALIAAWGSEDPDHPAFDCLLDGIVDGRDLAVLLSNWGPCE